MSTHPEFKRMLIACAVASVPFAQAPASDDQARSTFAFSASGGVEQTYDDNVMLQSVTDKADIASWETALHAQLAIDCLVTDRTSLKLTYTPTWTNFASRSSEDFFSHRFAGSVQGRERGVNFSAQGSVALIDGSEESVIWTGPGGVPATGAAAVRDRRDQAVYRGTLRVDWLVGDWILRPVAALYIADFRTAERATPGYQNNVDRNDLSAGIDVGRAIKPGFSGFLGYRHGSQDQATLLSYPEEYDNSYDRVLAAIEGRPVSWITLALSAGPEFRRYGPNVAATFPDRSVTNLFIDATATVTITDRDTVSLLARQFEQLSSSGRGVFEDLNFDVAWRHTFSKRLTSSLALHAYNTDFLRPAVRNDWLLSSRFQTSLSLDKAWAVDLTYMHEHGVSKVPNTAGREYGRNLVSLAARAKL